MLLKLEGLDERRVTVPADETLLQRVYVVAKPDYAAAAAERTPLRFWIEDVESGERSYKDVSFVGKGN